MPSGCCVVGCSIRTGTTLLCKVKNFSFPKCVNRREKWISAVKRLHYDENNVPRPWRPTENSRVCSRHFVTGKPVDDASHPDYVPTLELGHHLKRSSSENDNIERYNRVNKRRSVLLEAQSVPLYKREESQPRSTCITNSVEVQTINKESLSSSTQTVDLKQDIETMKVVNWTTDSDGVKKYTGLSLIMFNNLLTFLLTIFTPTCTVLSFGDQFLLTLIKLRHGFFNWDLARRFHISDSSVSVIFYDWLHILARELGQTLVTWPDKSVVKKNLPEVFRNSTFKSSYIIIDCAETTIDKPDDYEARGQTWSQYKQRNTIKYMVGISPTGAIMYTSYVWGGRVSDRELTINEDFCKHIPQGSVLLADRGFVIQDELAKYGIDLKIPAFTKGKPQLSRKETEETRQIARVRIHVERSIGAMKTWKILSSSLPYHLIKRPGDTCDWTTADKILKVIAALVNCRDKLVN